MLSLFERGKHIHHSDLWEQGVFIMKKIISAFTVTVMLFIMCIASSAVSLSSLPLVYNENDLYISLEKSVDLRADLKVDKAETLVIPKGKKLIINNKKVLTLNGNIYIENGGCLEVRSGKLLIGEYASLISDGTIKVGENGIISAEQNGSLTVMPDGTFKDQGIMLADNLYDNVVCFGEYKGKQQWVKTDIIGAVSFIQSFIPENIDSFSPDKIPPACKDFRVYEKKEARELLPESVTISSQDIPSSGERTIVKLFCESGQTVTMLYFGGSDSECVMIDNILFENK